MSAVEEPVAAAPPLPPSTPVLRTLVLCDLADSTALTERLGDQRAADLMRKHGRLARDILHRHGGQEIDKTDGFLLLFDRPIQAVAFALDYQRHLRKLGEEEFVDLRVRVGIHVGDVLLWQNTPDDVEHGAKRTEVEGLVKPTAARLMGLARPGQILLSGVSSTLAQRAVSELDAEFAERVRWRGHGNYRFKGVAETAAIYEVGEPGIASFQRPPSGAKAWRDLAWWRRPRAIVAEVTLLLCAAVLAGYVALRSEPSIAFTARDWVVIGDLNNLTGRNVFDASLEAAFRLSLEQSRFVNVVSDLQVRDALKRMGRESGTKVDRAIGAEIAQREGARALILPTITEIGGRVRVSAEVIDPRSRAVVYANAVDGNGADSVLPSVDQVVKQLRGQLGEALARITTDAQPLPKAATSSLDALRAFALAERMNATGQWSEALSLYDEAIRLDPEFALARIGIARLRLGSDDRAGALEQLKLAQQSRARLPARDALFLDALLATYDKPSEMLDKWKLLGALYPDSYSAHANYALFAWQYTNQYEAAIESAKLALSEHNPKLGSAHYLLGTLYLGNERYQEATAELQKAQAMRGHLLGLVLAEAHAAQRDFNDAGKVLAEFKPSGIASNDISKSRFVIAFELDQGHWDTALSAAAAAVQEAKGVGPLYQRVFAGTELTLHAYVDPYDSFNTRLETFLREELVAIRRTDDADHDHAIFSVLVTAYLAAHTGHANLSQAAIEAATIEASPSPYPNTTNLWLIVRAERLRLAKKADEAVRMLETRIDGTELYLTHVALRDALTDTQDWPRAMRETQWLATHRGRAYEEFGSIRMLQPLNIVESNLAKLVEAELALASGQKSQAESSLAMFRQTWPKADQLPFLAGRLELLDHQLQLASSR